MTTCPVCERERVQSYKNNDDSTSCRGVVIFMATERENRYGDDTSTRCRGVAFFIEGQNRTNREKDKTLEISNGETENDGEYFKIRQLEQ
jgi:NADH:ubiquinone oxidoreductase subunit E